MYIYKNYYNNFLKKDLIIKLNLKNTQEIPKIKKISTTMNLHQSFLSNENFSLNSLVAFELILTQTPINIISKKNVLNKNIKINNIIGFKCDISRKNTFKFFQNILFFGLLENKNTSGFLHKQINNNTFSFQVKDIFFFPFIQKNTYLFDKFQSRINIDLITNTHNKLINKIFLSGLKLPLSKEI